MKRAGCGAGPNSIGRAGSSNGNPLSLVPTTSQQIRVESRGISGQTTPGTGRKIGTGGGEPKFEQDPSWQVAPMSLPAEWPARIALIDGPLKDFKKNTVESHIGRGKLSVSRARKKAVGHR
jgi:hypothetical protein